MSSSVESWCSLLAAQTQLLTLELASRDLIVSSFLLLVGVSLVLAHRGGISRTRYWRRIALVSACALLVTVGSYVTLPKTFITLASCIASWFRRSSAGRWRDIHARR